MDTKNNKQGIFRKVLHGGVSHWSKFICLPGRVWSAILISADVRGLWMSVCISSISLFLNSFLWTFLFPIVQHDVTKQLRLFGIKCVQPSRVVPTSFVSFLVGKMDLPLKQCLRLSQRLKLHAVLCCV